MSRITSFPSIPMQPLQNLQRAPRFRGTHTHEDGTTCNKDHDTEQQPKAPLLQRIKDWVIALPGMLKAFFTDAWSILKGDLQHLFSDEKPHVHDEHCKHSH